MAITCPKCGSQFDATLFEFGHRVRCDCGTEIEYPGTAERAGHVWAQEHKPSVFDRVQNLLKQHGISFQVLHHEPVYTSEEAARVRGTPLASGAKALICKGEEGFVMFVIPADRKLDSQAVRRAKGWKKLRFATREEVLELTGLAPGSIPPFGSLFGLPTLCDERLGQNETINFNAGDHSISVSMRHADYLEVERPELGIVAAESAP
jgi:Ala-tRNA(Pro) deacylase